MPVRIPAGVDVKVEGSRVTVKGPKGELSREFHPDMTIERVDGALVVRRPSEEKFHKALHGLTRAILANMVTGVTQGYEKQLEIKGVGYRAAMQGKQVVLNVGYTHPVAVDPEPGVQIEVPQPTRIVVKGIDREKVGQTAARIRAVREPEPYLGKGIMYAGERIRRKAGKAGKVGK